ncbi:MAG: hypothetical protein U1E96_10130 [Azonexus sp.]
MTRLIQHRHDFPRVHLQHLNTRVADCLDKPALVSRQACRLEQQALGGAGNPGWRTVGVSARYLPELAAIAVKNDQIGNAVAQAGRRRKSASVGREAQVAQLEILPQQDALLAFALGILAKEAAYRVIP